MIEEFVFVNDDLILRLWCIIWRVCDTILIWLSSWVIWLCIASMSKKRFDPHWNVASWKYSIDLRDIAKVHLFLLQFDACVLE